LLTNKQTDRQTAVETEPLARNSGGNQHWLLKFCFPALC